MLILPKPTHMIKSTIITMLQFLHLLIIGLPLAIILYFTAHIFFELKRIIKWVKT
jgi:hypothetical protein